MRPPRASSYDFDIDKYLNPLIPPSFTHRLPRLIAHFLGHRDKPQQDIGNILVAFWAFLGAFVGVMIISWVFMIPDIKEHGPPLAIASFGAAAILEYNTIESPLAQPRNTILGHILAALTGISTTKLLHLSPHFSSLRWLAGALSVGAASAVMTLTKSIYPPAGATALLAAVDPTVESLGWYLLPLVCVCSATTLGSSLVVNNLQRRYPTYWWTAGETGGAWEGWRGARVRGMGEGKQAGSESCTSSSSSEGEEVEKGDGAGGEDSGRMERSLVENTTTSILITPDRVIVPDAMFLADEEKSVLEILRGRLHEQQHLLRVPSHHHHHHNHHHHNGDVEKG